MNLREARTAARAELADEADVRAQAAHDTADRNARDVEGARDARRMAAAYAAVATLLDPVRYPPPQRPVAPPPGMDSLTTPDGRAIEELTRG